MSSVTGPSVNDIFADICASQSERAKALQASLLHNRDAFLAVTRIIQLTERLRLADTTPALVSSLQPAPLQPIDPVAPTPLDVPSDEEADDEPLSPVTPPSGTRYTTAEEHLNGADGDEADGEEENEDAALVDEARGNLAFLQQDSAAGSAS